jgi:site-specific DNA-methyltransferase (adenine-specific)
MNKVLLGDNREILKSIDAESIDLVITSPPYKNKDNYSDDLMRDAFAQVYRVQKENTLLFLNFGHLAEDKFRPFRVCSILIDIGYQLNDTITWVKNHYKPIQGSKRLNNLTEFIFVLYKGKMPKLNRLALGVPYKDKTNAKRFAGGRDLKCGGNVWYINYETITSADEKLHNDLFPVELPKRCIKLCGYPVNVVLDPFSGSASTGVAAIKLGKIFTGIECNTSYHQIGMKRLGGVSLIIS